jgi:Leucine-rich repeat (LRR) protein
MGLMEVPSELFRMKNVKTLHLYNNKLCSLPSEIAHLVMLDTLIVRLWTRSDYDLTLYSGLQEPAHVSSARAWSAGQSEAALREAPALEADGS